MSVCHTLVLNQNEHYRFCTYTESSIIDQFNKQSAAFCHSEMTLTMHKQTNKQTGKQNLWVDFNKKSASWFAYKIIFMAAFKFAA